MSIIGSPRPPARGSIRRSRRLKKLLWLPQSGPSEDGHLLPLRRTGPLPRLKPRKPLVFWAFVNGLWAHVQILVPTRNPEEPELLGLLQPGSCLAPEARTRYRDLGLQRSDQDPARVCGSL